MCFLLFIRQVIFSESGWTHSGIAAKWIGEIIRILISAHFRYFRYTVRIVEQKPLRASHSQKIQIIWRGCVKLLLEFVYKPHVAQKNSIGKLINIYFFVKIFSLISYYIIIILFRRLKYGYYIRQITFK